MIRILVVDDNPDHRFLTKRALQSLSGEIALTMEFAEDGEVGLEKLRASRPDLLLLDIKMPRKDGFDVLEAVRRDPATATLPVVMFTSSEAGADVERATKMGASDYVTKPLDAREFADGLRACIRRWAPRLQA